MTEEEYIRVSAKERLQIVCVALAHLEVSLPDEFREEFRQAYVTLLNMRDASYGWFETVEDEDE